MQLIFKIAWRNILRHKGKSLIIGLILFLGSLLMTVGNGVISGMDRGIEKNIVNGFLGDLVIVAEKQKTDNVLMNMMGELIEPISTYAQIKPILQKQAFVKEFLPVGKNMGMALSDAEDSQMGPMFMIGVDFAAYQKMFPNNLVPIEGRLLNAGERGILVTSQMRAEHLFMYTNRWAVPEGGKIIEANLSKDAKENLDELKTMDSMVVLGMNTDNSSTDVRFPIRGIVKYKALDTIFGHFCLVDIESYRECMGYLSASAQKIPVAKENQVLLNLDDTNLDAMFASDSLMVENSRNTSKPAAVLDAVSKPTTIEDIELGIYNLVFVKIKPGTSPTRALKTLNQALKDAKTNVRAVTWKAASGVIGSLTTLIKGSLLMFVSFLFLVAVIIIINTLTMAAMERTPEIGMMRAIGAHKSFIQIMFFSETGLLAAIFGGAGLLLGILIVNFIPLLHITTTNDFVQLLYGGDTFNPMLKWSDILLTVIELGLVTLAAAFYPMQVASAIKPLDAIARD